MACCGPLPWMDIVRRSEAALCIACVQEQLMSQQRALAAVRGVTTN